ncbi:FtsX-like permease family protein [compost metagenome]
MTITPVRDLGPLLRSLPRHRPVVLLIILECSIAMAILCNVVAIITDSTNRLRTATGLDEDRIAIVQNIAVIGSSNSGTIGDGLLALRALPFVEEAAFGPTPFAASTAPIRTSTDQIDPIAEPYIYFGSQGLSRTLGLKIVAGTMLSDEMLPDIEQALVSNGVVQLPALITRSLAERLYPTGDALGKNIYTQVWGSYTASMRVVGIVADFRSDISDSRGDVEAIIAESSFTNQAIGGLYLIRGRSPVTPEQMGNFATTLSMHMPGFVQEPPKSIEQLRKTYFAGEAARSNILKAILLVVVSSTALGIFGLTHFWVLGRKPYIGIRRALGARRLDIASYFMMENLLISMIGIALGVVTSIMLNRVLAAYFEVAPLGGTLLATSAFIIVITCQLAALLPALKVSYIEPSLIGKAS